MNYTDRGLREVLSGLRDAAALVARKRAELQAQMGSIEAELSALGKIEASVGAAIEVLRLTQAEREKANV
jgi:hypothetical protein